VNEALLGAGTVRHARLRPVHHAFDYPALFLLLPMRGGSFGAVPRNRWAPIAFHDRDHGDGGPDALAWLDALLAGHGIRDAQGPVWLQCFPRVLGFAFKPVSFWYCHRADGSLRAVVAEVNNTFGERHSYVLDGAAWGRESVAAKIFRVSPFCEVQGRYRFRFLHAPERGRIVARVDHDDGQGPLLRTSISGVLQPATRQALRRAAFRYAAQCVSVLWRIHWQALRLAWRRVPFHSAPAPARERRTPA
jgi:DUF1365 family protein